MKITETTHKIKYYITISEYDIEYNSLKDLFNFTITQDIKLKRELEYINSLEYSLSWSVFGPFYNYISIEHNSVCVLENLYRRILRKEKFKILLDGN